MHALRIGKRHRRAGDIAVAARTHAAADDDRTRDAAGVLGLQLLHQRDRIAVDPAHRRIVEPSFAPHRSRRARSGFENEARLGVPAELEIAAEVAPQARAALLRLEQHEGRKLRQGDALLEDQNGFDAAVRQEPAAILLRQAQSRVTHVRAPSSGSNDGRHCRGRVSPAK
jgi:hypothetical protein